MTPLQKAAAARFALFREHPDILPVTMRYADWPRSDHERQISAQLTGLCLMRFTGHLSRQAYDNAIGDLCGPSGLPPNDFNIIAQCAFEYTGYFLVSSGQLAAFPEDDGDV